MGAVENPGARRAVAAAAHSDAGAAQRNAEQSATGVAGRRRTGRDRRRGGSRSAARAGHRKAPSRTQAASGPATAAGESARVEEVVPAPTATCRQCGQETAVIGYDESEQLDVEPARYFVRVTKREKRACRCCEQGTVTMAPLAPRIVEKGLASDAVVIDTVVAQVLRSPAAVPAGGDPGARSGTGDRPGDAGWLGDAGGRVAGAGGRQRCARICSRQDYLQADETTVPVQMHDGRGADHQAYLWQYGKPGGETVFDFRLGRGREGPRKFLGKWEGILQTDGYQAYDGVGGPKLVHVGCWAHARRKFVDAVKVNPQDGPAVQMVTRMDALFLVDRDARQETLYRPERLELRREHAQAVGGRNPSGVRDWPQDVLPKSALGKAVTYTLNQWPKLRALFRLRAKSSCRTTWRRTRCGRWHWAARTGCTWAA